jgi:hypothetical protein
MDEIWIKCKSCGHWEHDCEEMEICEREDDEPIPESIEQEYKEQPCSSRTQ